LDTYSNKKILILGGLGFIGSSLARKLVDYGAKVTIVDSLIPEYGGNLYNISDIKDKVKLNISDVRDDHALKWLIKSQDYLFNLAGQTSHADSMVNPKVDLDINVSAQLSILESCRLYNSDVKIIFASTRQIYGKPDFLPVTEEHPIRPVDVNGINKLAGESYHTLYNKIYGIRSTGLRLTNTYGPGMRVKDARQTFLGIWIRRLIEGHKIRVFGDGSQLRDFNYIDDCVSALLLAGASDSTNGKVYNLGGHEIISLKDLAKLLTSDLYDGEFEIVPFPKEREVIDIGDYYGDYSLITKDIGWKPKISLNAGLVNTINYYTKNKIHYWDA